jgi:hypothetical protein
MYIVKGALSMLTVSLVLALTSCGMVSANGSTTEQGTCRAGGDPQRGACRRGGGGSQARDEGEPPEGCAGAGHQEW